MSLEPEAHKSGSGGPLGAIQRFFDSLASFWQRVTEGLEIQALWGQFAAEARSSYSLYTREVDWDALAHETRLRRFFKICRALFWAMLMKLSPARRVFLLLALILGILSLPSQAGGQAPGGSHISPLVPIAMLVFLLALELADRVTMKRDLEIAREIQRWLVPEKPPQIPGADIAFTSRPANTVGGDYYDAFLMDGGVGAARPTRLLIVVADVAGKSVPAALLMATFQASLRSLTTSSISLSELVTGMNRYACAHSLGGRRFTTAFFAELNPETRVLSYISAGHNPPMIRRASGQLEHLSVGNLPLGIGTAVVYEGGSAVLSPGDLLIIFTDGLVEAVNEAEEEYGEDRLMKSLEGVPLESAQKTLEGLVASVDAFSGRARQHDDLTCLILRVA
jgi:phosphoserine phosphatase RsbU/P